MIVGFSKLFADIIHSTVWREEMHVKIVWVTMLAMADRHGQVLASVPGLADAAKVTLEQCLDALEKFKLPDEYSRTKEYDGRRIIEIDGGWLLLNYEKFRARKDDEETRIKTRERVRKHRAEAKAVTESVTVTQCSDIAEAESEANADSEAEKEAALPPMPELNQEAIDLYHEIFPDHTLSPFLQDTVGSRVENLDAWRCSLIFWKENGYRANSVGKICNYYDEEVAGKHKSNGTNRGNNKQTPAEIIASRPYRNTD